MFNKGDKTEWRKTGKITSCELIHVDRTCLRADVVQSGLKAEKEDEGWTTYEDS